MNRKQDEKIVVTMDGVPEMLDSLFECRDGRFYADRERPVPFFQNAPDETLVSGAASGACCGRTGGF